MPIGWGQLGFDIGLDIEFSFSQRGGETFAPAAISIFKFANYLGKMLNSNWMNLKIWLEMFLRHKRRTVNYYLRIFTNSVGKYNSRIERYLIITIVKIRIPIIILLLLILYILYYTMLYYILYI